MTVLRELREVPSKDGARNSPWKQGACHVDAVAVSLKRDANLIFLQCKFLSSNHRAKSSRKAMPSALSHRKELGHKHIGLTASRLGLRRATCAPPAELLPAPVSLNTSDAHSVRRCCARRMGALISPTSTRVTRDGDGDSCFVGVQELPCWSSTSRARLRRRACSTCACIWDAGQFRPPGESSSQLIPAPGLCIMASAS